MTFRLPGLARAATVLVLSHAVSQGIVAASEPALVDHDDSYLYRLPYADEASWVVVQSWGSPLSHTGSEHFTIDFAMPIGTPVHAAREGVVIGVEQVHERGCWSNGCARFANYVVIRHSDGTVGEYFHLNKDGVIVTEGDRVKRGQLIAFSGNTGYTNSPHLHFGVYTTTADGRRRSIDIRFVTATGVLSRPRAGNRYRTAASRLSVSAR